MLCLSLPRGTVGGGALGVFEVSEASEFRCLVPAARRLGSMLKLA